jgi:serine/threonine protein kinase
MNNSSGDLTSVDIADPVIRRQRVKAIVANVLEQRSRGQAVSDSEILAAYPGLIDELKRELEVAGHIRQALLSARGGGPAPEKLQLLSDSEIDETIEPPSDPGGDAAEERELLPRILGYFLEEEISRGGQATVYKAKQESTGRAVAIKVVAGGPFVSSRHRARFEREAAVLATFDHPNIVSIIERGRTPDGSFYFVMQYVDGLALDDYWMQQISRDSEGTRKTIQLFVRVANAVEGAHERGVVHRDLKPSNIRVDRRDEPHVLDFGLARSTGEGEGLPLQTLTMPGQIVGSVPWASPEQAAGLSTEVDVRSDVYSLGVILYQALTGKFPYSLDGTIDQVLLRIRTAQSAPPSKQDGARSGVDRRLDAIVLKSLSKSPEDRYESARKLALDLEAWLAGKPMQAVPLVSGRRRVVAAMIGLIVGVIAVAMFVEIKIVEARPPTVMVLPQMIDYLGINLIRIPAGSFWFGSPDTETDRNSDEQQRYVQIKNPFYMSMSVITQIQYQQVMKQNPSDPHWLGSNMPVTNVSWNDAVEFCHRLGEHEHRRFRLPTEVEWEYACRAGSTGPFNDVWQPERMGWYAENSGQAVHAVMGKWPNAWGLFDMHGNVAEWCADSIKKYNGNATEQTPLAEVRIIRGGTALTPMFRCRSASRESDLVTGYSSSRGFRVVCDS